MWLNAPAVSSWYIAISGSPHLATSRTSSFMNFRGRFA
jgi:hypothetical protein